MLRLEGDETSCICWTCLKKVICGLALRRCLRVPLRMRYSLVKSCNGDCCCVCLVWEPMPESSGRPQDRKQKTIAICYMYYIAISIRMVCGQRLQKLRMLFFEREMLRFGERQPRSLQTPKS